MRRAYAALALAIFTLGGAVPAPAAQAPATWVIETIGGTGVAGRSGDGGPALAAEINHPRGIALLPDGSIVFAEPYGHTVRRIAPDGTIATIAGTGAAGFSGDGGPATQAQLDFVHGVSLTPDGAILVADTWNDRIRRLEPDGTIRTVAGSGASGYGGDGGTAVEAAIDDPRGVAALPDGGFLIPDTNNERVRRVWPDGTITTVAGTGEAGFSGDGGPATAARIDQPFAATPLPDGGFLIGDSGNARIRRVWPDGTITTVAGTGVEGHSGDGGPAVEAEISAVSSIALTPDGGYVFAEPYRYAVREVGPDGTIETIAGTAVAGFSGDGGPAAEARLDQPKALAVRPDGSILVGDAANNRIRLLRLNRAPRIESARILGRRARSETAVVRVCDDAPGDLLLEVGVTASGRKAATFQFRRRLDSRCAVYRLAWRLDAVLAGAPRHSVRIRARDAADSWGARVRAR